MYVYTYVVTYICAYIRSYVCMSTHVTIAFYVVLPCVAMV